MNNKKHKKEEGAVALFLTIVILGIGIAIAGSLIFVFLNRLQAAENIALSEQAYFTAEAGIEDELLRFMNSDMNVSTSYPYTIVLGDGETEVVAEEEDDDRTITSRGNMLDRERKLSTVVRRTTDGVAFNYGAQVGAGGFTMGQNSTLLGSVYANGDIRTTSPGAEIEGDAFAAGSSVVDLHSNTEIGGNVHGYNVTGADHSSAGWINGNVTAVNTIDGSNIGGDAHADNLVNCTIGGDAFYQSNMTCSVTGQVEDGQDPPEELEELDLPISEETIEDWRLTAVEEGGVDNCGGSSVYATQGHGEVLGPGKFECDLEISHDVTIGGYIWVEGDILIRQNEVVLDSGFGSRSSAIVAYYPNDPENRGTVEVRSGAQIRGTNHENSFLMVVSENRGASVGNNVDAVDLGQLSHSDIFYSKHGKISIGNQADVYQVVGYEVEMGNNMELSYQSGLADVQFSAGPGGGYSILSWQEL